MCRTCDDQLSRRRMLTGAAAMAVTVAAGPAMIGAAEAAGPAGPSLTPKESLDRLKAGNARFVSKPQACALDLQNRRKSLAQRQAPWATIVGCADSRVAPELLFGGLGLGELFVARNAGNLVDTATLGTVEYGALNLGSPLIVVLGHERCGAVAAACDAVAKNASFPGAIGPMIAPILPAAKAMQGKSGDFLDNTVRESAKRSAAGLPKSSAILAKLVAEKKLRIIAARYDLDDGKVEFFE